ncbi:HERV-H LTR-associating protein 1 [Odontesthes bonariensis]
MAGFGGFMQRPPFRFITFVSAVLLFLILSQALRPRQLEERHERDLPDSTEIPAEHIDPAAIDLTSLVNTLINSSQSGSRQLFSLLSVTSYSSLALHKLTLLVYNISSIKSIESSTFRRRFCYCVTNETNDLTDFTAILLDVMGNSTSYLHELFKSSSILSVSQRNNSDCIYICVMAGQRGREAPELWEVGSIIPLFNQTIVEGPHKVANISSFRLPADWHQLPTNLSHIPPSGMSSTWTSRVQSTAHAPLDETDVTAAEVTTSQLLTTPPFQTTIMPKSTSAVQKPETPRAWTTLFPLIRTLKQPTTPVSGTTAAAPTTRTPKTTTFPPAISLSRLITAAATQQSTFTAAGRTTVSTRTTTPSKPVETEKPGCPWRRPELSGESVSGGTTTVGAHKLQPCVLELCKFFSQCLCRPSSPKTRMKRYCDDSHLWYVKHTLEVCRRVRRISFSRNLKQRCLTKMCNKL